MAKVSSVSFIGWLIGRPWLRTAGFYPAEYVLMLLSSLGLLSSLSLLGGILVNYWLAQSTGGYAGTSVLYLVASLLVITPLHLALYWRVRHSDIKKVTDFSLRVAYGGLGFYMIVLVSAIVALDTWIVYVLLQWAFGLGGDSRYVLTTLAVFGQALIWIKYSAWHFSLMREGLGRPKFYVIKAATAVAVIIILALIFPGSAGRAAARDEIKVNDLTAIAESIDIYVSDNGDLPGDLSDLDDLDSAVQRRLDNYEYEANDFSSEIGFGLEYQLCATFDTKTGTASASAYTFYYHRKGRQCFDRTAYGGGIIDYQDLQDSPLQDQLLY